jgi:hypothetical protein
VVKRTQRESPSRPARRQEKESKPVWPVVERHSGEGSASALETLQKLEKRRVVTRAADPRHDPDT